MQEPFDLGQVDDSEDRINFIGSLPMQEPPYSLTYQREKRERKDRLRNGMNETFHEEDGRQRLSASVPSAN